MRLHEEPFSKLDPAAAAAAESARDRASLPRQGAHLGPAGVHYCVWAPSAEQIGVVVKCAGLPEQRVVREVELRRQGDGFFAGHDPEGRAGDLYWLRLDQGECLPDPVSRFQPEGVDGPSMVVDPRAFGWTDRGWRRPDLRDLVIYEIHLGTFTPGGTFRGATERLGHLRELGVTAVEIMPIAEFPGGRNWGYDGAMLYAPAHAYGTPEDFRALVDAAHAQSLSVILDVVYNHFGPRGNRLRSFAPHFFDASRLTPWGDSVHFDGPSAPQVRAFFRQNLAYWMEEFHVDGFRLDATHAIYDESHPHILRELRDEAHARDGFVIAEDERQEEMLLSAEGFHLDGAWADDFHHSVEVALIGERSIQRRLFSGRADELAETLRRGWKDHAPTPASAHLRPRHFVVNISNHDHAGNRPWGDRLHHLCDPAAYRAASALLCLTPETPLLFMGQEWGAQSPFAYFTDHEETLGRDILKGRRKDLREFAPHAAELARRGLPSPQDPAAYVMSRLNWEEKARASHAGLWSLYQEALRWRRQTPFAHAHRFDAFEAAALPGEIVALRAAASGAEDWLVLCRLRADAPAADLRPADYSPCALPAGRCWRSVWSSNDQRFGGDRGVEAAVLSGAIQFSGPELLLLRSDALASKQGDERSPDAGTAWTA